DIAIVFDPVADGAKVQEKLDGVGATFSLAIDAGTSPTEHHLGSAGEVDGLVYRIATSTALTTVNRTPALTCKEPGDHKEIPFLLAAPVASQSAFAIVPDTRAEYTIPSHAGAFTTTNLTYGFSNGMLTDYTDQQPSEIAAIANIPLRIANDLVAIPTQL